MRKLFLITCFIGFYLMSHAQGLIGVQVSNDSVLIGNRISVEFKIENAQGSFEAPEFEGMKILSGPNTMSSMQTINGETTSSTTYSFVVEPVEIGELIIDKAYLLSDQETLESDFVKINVYPNPDGIIQEPPSTNQNFNFNFQFDDFFNFPLPKEKEAPVKKKKYKLKKI